MRGCDAVTFTAAVRFYIPGVVGSHCLNGIVPARGRCPGVAPRGRSGCQVPCRFGAPLCGDADLNIIDAEPASDAVPDIVAVVPVSFALFEGAVMLTVGGALSTYTPTEVLGDSTLPALSVALDSIV